ncbi:MAG: zinc ribbon domain-containing protein [Ruminococcus flavefaciens]|nr:zinc ribbon domain-containing protein [Ruminococcus flavefaciens]
MLICPQCGTPALNEHSNFCYNCGTKLREPPPEIAALIPSEEERLTPMVVDTLVSVDTDLLRSLLGLGEEESP